MGVVCCSISYRAMRTLILLAQVLACFGRWTGHRKFPESDIKPVSTKASIAYLLSMGPAMRVANRVRTPVMEEGKVIFGGNNWEDKQKAKNSVGRYEATDTPDFFEEGGPTTIDGADDLFGSSGMGHGNENRKDAKAELADLFASNDAMIVQTAHEYDADVDFVVPANAVVKEVGITLGQKLTLTFTPKTKMFEDYYVGFTKDTSNGFVIHTPTAGTMERKGGAPTKVIVECKAPNGVGTLCFSLPEMDFMSEYYKITCQGR